MIGAIGAEELDDVLVFNVSDDGILTFQNFSRKNAVRFTKNDVLGKKPVSQYIGPDLDKISLTIELNAQYGVDPRKTMDKLIYIQRDGVTISFIIGKGGFGYYRWRIVDLNMTWKHIDSMGNLLAASCELSLEEYV